MTALTAHDVTIEEGGGSGVHVGPVGRVQPANQAEVFGGHGREHDRRWEQFARGLGSGDGRFALGLCNVRSLTAARARDRRGSRRRLMVGRLFRGLRRMFRRLVTAGRCLGGMARIDRCGKRGRLWARGRRLCGTEPAHLATTEGGGEDKGHRQPDVDECPRHTLHESGHFQHPDYSVRSPASQPRNVSRRSRNSDARGGGGAYRMWVRCEKGRTWRPGRGAKRSGVDKIPPRET